MAQLKKCSQCQKEIKMGQLYTFYTGKKRGKRIVNYSNPGQGYFCLPCAEREKNDPKNPIKNNNMEPDRKKIKQYFLSNDIRFVTLNNDNSLMI
jgi:hypothetical protein